MIASQKSCFLLVLLQEDRGVPWEGKVRTRQADAGDRLDGTGGWVTPSYVNGSPANSGGGGHGSRNLLK